MRTCSRCGAPTPTDARFCPACGAALVETPATSQALKTVTVVFTDMVDSTALGERFDPESLHAVMREYFGAIRTVVERYGGSVEKFIGDAVMAVFGVPAVHEDDALRAVSAAAAIHAAIGELGARLERDAGAAIEVRSGINTGEVLSQTADGATGRLVGDAVNVAARLQQAAGPGEILVGPTTYALVRDAVRAKPLGPLAVKGRSAPVQAHALLEVLPAPEAPARPHGPLVGRDRELRLLREALERVVADRTPHLFTILGAPGVGKSRLVDALRARSEAKVLQGRCLPYGEGITYWPLAEIVRSAASIDTDDPPDVARAKLSASAGEGEEERAIAASVAHVVGLAEADARTDDVFWAVRKYFERLAARGPLVAVFDDVHWAEPTMLDLLDHLIDSIGNVPLLVVCVARLELLDVRPTWGGARTNASSVVLAPLGAAECRSLLGSLLGDSPAVDEITEAVFRVADGNPLFVEEMVSMLVEDGLLEQVGGSWRAVRDLSAVSVPPTIQALVSARLDRLSFEEREVVGTAAVMGQVFAPRAVADLAPAAVGARVEDALARLTRKQLVMPGDDEFAGGRMYAFRHLLIRDTAYEHLPRLTRATIHERYAEWLVQVLGNRIAEYGEVVGYHLEQAHRYERELRPLGPGRPDLAERAAERLAQGGRRAAARQDAPAAVKLLSRAAALLPEPDERRLPVLPDLGLALYESGEYAEALAVFAEAIELAESVGDVRAATTCRILKERARIHGDPQVTTEELKDVAEDAIATLTDLGDEYGLCYAWDLVAYVHECAGRSREAVAAFREAATHADKSGIKSLIGYQKRALVRSLAWGEGHVSEIIPLAQDLLEWGTATGDRYSEVRALLTLAQARAMLGEFDAAREYVLLQTKTCADVAFEFIHASGAFERAQVELLAGDVDRAEEEARTGCAMLQRLGEKAVLPTLQVQHADILYRRDLLDDAERVVATARELSTPDDSLTEMKWRSVTAKLLAARGESAEAISLAVEAAAIADATGYLDWRAGVLVDLAEVMAGTGRAEGARDALKRAATLYRLKGNAVSERAVEGLLREIETA